MKKFIILIFSCLLLVSCYNKPYCEELIKQYKEVESEIWSAKYRIELNSSSSDLRYYYRQEIKELNMKVENLEKEKDRIRLELLNSHCPKRILEKERIIKVENKNKS